MHQPHIAVQNRNQRLAGNFGIAVGDGDSVLFVQHHHHLRLLVTQVVDQAVMQAAKAGTGVEQDVGNVHRPQHVGNRVAAPHGFAGFGRGGNVAAHASNRGNGHADSWGN